MPSEQRLMKDGLDAEAIRRIAANLRRVWRPFPRERFVRDACVGLDNLELKDRVRHIIAVLGAHLPDDFPRAAEILIRAGRGWDAGNPNDPHASFAAWPVTDYVGTFGLDHPGVSLAALAELTALFSAEFAIRPFLVQHEELTLATLTQWTTHDDPHVRRLVSEGTRTRLPWGGQLGQFIRDPRPVVVLLDVLRDDPSEYVRRSVGNNLNDISKDHADLVIRICRRWQRAKSNDPDAKKNRAWIIGRATRTLVKDGHPDVWSLLGYADPPLVRVTNFRLDKKALKLGDAITFTARVRSESDQSQRLAIDYAVHHVKAAGHTTAKVFKLKTTTLAPGAVLTLEKRHVLRRITTRQYHTGRHAIELRINGQSFGQRTFQLTGV
jgi:3-methyladenine DNA glycosylase AlkC